MVTHYGSCHCESVRYTVRASARIVASRCNCSICSMAGHLALIVPAERFTLLSGSEHLITYTFNTGRAKHPFCARCGVKSFYYPRSHPDGISANVHCLAPGTVETITFETVDGQNWEHYYTDGTNAPFPN